jgi:hypothetical protein
LAPLIESDPEQQVSRRPPLQCLPHSHRTSIMEWDVPFVMGVSLKSLLPRQS